MKKIDLKGNNLTKVIAMLLVTCVTIGLVSSTAIKLAASTYYLQNKRQLKTNIPVVDKVIDAIVNTDIPFVPDAVVPPTTEAPTEAPTQAPTEAPTQAPETTAPSATNDTTAGTTASGGDSSGDSGSGDIMGTITGLLGGVDIGGMLSGIDIGGMLGGITGGGSEETTTTTEPTTESEASIEQKKDILSKYKAVVNASKTTMPGFTKVTYRAVEKGFIDGIFLHSLESAYPDYFISKENAEAAPVVVPSHKPTSEFLIDNNYYACMLANADASDAIESATSVKLEDGTQKIVITLREEADPAITASDAKKASSYTSAMFPVISNAEFEEMVGSTLKLTSVSSSNITYKNCTVELIYKPITGSIVSLKQTTTYVGQVKVDYDITAKCTVTETSEYSNFDYSI